MGNEKNDNALAELEKRLWAAADQLWANSPLRPSEYSTPVLGLIFLRFAYNAFTKAEAELKGKSAGRRTIGKLDYQAKGVVFLPEEARFSNLLNLQESVDLGRYLNEAMKAVERENEDLKDVLPKTYQRIDNATLFELLKIMNGIPLDIPGDAFGKIYEYFLGAFAMKEGQKGGEFFTPPSMVELIVEIIEPFHGRLLDPASGSGGMFVASARFVQNHKMNPNSEIAIYGQERVAETMRLCKMNLAVHGLSGDIRQGNTYYEDIHESIGKFDFVMANPPFNVSGVNKEKIKDDPRFRLGLPSTDIANYLWIQIFYHSLNAKGRAGFVMANSAADARGSELEIRKKLIQSGAVDAMLSVGSNFFYTVTLPATLWFFDRGKPEALKDTVLFIDAHHIYRQIDRAHREFTPEQIEFLANIVRLYRGKEPEFTLGSEAMLKEKFPKGNYADSQGLCKVATRKEIEAQGWSLNPGRYVGVAPGEEISDEDFKEKLEKLNEELENLNTQALELEETIAQNMAEIFKA
jgi:type I restriction enzyme M protein